VGNVQGGLVLAGPELSLRGLKADAYGGRLTGEFTATLSDTPSYVFQGDVNGASVTEIAALIPSMAGRVTGSASGRISAAARGTRQADLLQSLQGSGSFRVREMVIRSPEFLAGIEQLSDSTQVRTQGRFANATARFEMGDGNLRVEQLSFADRSDRFEITGDIAFSGALNLRVTAMPPSEFAGADAAATPDPWVLGGTLQAPEMTAPTRVARARAGAAAASR
jgi:uncharacterized protein involved in outer membrane biogenesis